MTWMCLPVRFLRRLTFPPFLPTALAPWPFSTTNTSCSSVSRQSLTCVPVTFSKREMYRRVSSVKVMSPIRTNSCREYVRLPWAHDGQRGYREGLPAGRPEPEVRALEADDLRGRLSLDRILL